MAEEVILLGSWLSSFAMRVKIALVEKGIKFAIKEEDLMNKSRLLLETNSVHKKVHILIHNKKLICESLIIIQYIDEIWHHKSPLLPSNTYLRSQIYGIGKRIWQGKGEDKEAAKKEMIGFLKNMEGELGDKPFFGGVSIGLVDVALVPFTTWFYTYETLGNFSIEAECPKLLAWAKRCTQKESVRSSLADPHKLYEFALGFRKKFGID